MSVNIAARLIRALQGAGLQIVSVSIGADEDRSTWTVQPSSLQASAQPIIDAFNPDAPEYATAERDAEIDNFKALQALARATYELKTTAWTLAQFRDRIKAIYRAL